MIRARIVKVFLPAFTLLLLAGVFQWLLHTTSGARFLLEHVTELLPGDFVFESLDGNLGSGLEVQGFSFDGSALSIAAANIHTKIAFDLLPPSVAIESLLVDQVYINHRGDDAEDKSPAEILVGLASPLPLHFAKVQIGRLSFRDSDAQSAFEATEVHLSARWQDRFELSELAFMAGGVQFQAAGEFEFARPFALDANISSWLKPTANGRVPAPGMRLQTTLNGNLDELAVQATLDRPELAVDGHLRDVLTAPTWDAHLKSEVLQWPLAGATGQSTASVGTVAADDPSIAWQQFTADITGTGGRYKLSAQGVLDLKGKAGPDNSGAGNSGPGNSGAGVSADLDLRGSGDLHGLQLERLSLSGDLVKLVATGPVSWTDGLRFDLATEVERFSPGRWIPDWPEDHPIHGTLEARWQSGQLIVPAFNAQAGESDFRVTGSAMLDPAGKVFEVDLDWQSLRWPLAGEQAMLRGDSGELKVSGHPDDWTVAGKIQAQAGNWPQGDLVVSGYGDVESVHLQIQQGEVLGGQFAGQASYRWVDQRPWTADLTAKNLDVTALAGGYPLLVSGNVKASGLVKSSTLGVNIQQLTGRAHGQPFQASGEIGFEAGLLRARDLLVRSGSSHLALNGAVQDPAGIRFSGEIDSLASFLDQAGGSISGSGRISLDALKPVLDITLQGNGLAWGDWRMATLSAGPLDSGTEGYADPFALRMDVTGLSVGNRTIDAISLTSHGQLPLEHTRISARRKQTRLEAAISGTLQDWQALASARWSGLLESMRLSNDEIGTLELEQAARFALEHSAASIEPACFRGSNNGLWCADLNWADMNQKDRDHLVVNASLDKVPLNLARFILGTDLAFTQMLDGTLHWEKLPGSSPVADVQIRVSEGQIISADESATLQTGPGLFGFIIENGQLRAGNMDITFPESGAIDVDFSAPDISRGADSPLQGRAQVSFSSLETFLPWLDPLDQAEGVINAEVQLAGTMADPRLTGHASLVRGRIEHLATGLVLNDIKLAGAVFEDNHTELTGNFKAGDGAGLITASVTFEQILKPQAELSIDGQDLTLVNVPDMSIKVDPDLNLQWHDGALQLNGSVRVSHAQISPRYLPTATADESPDLVIVAGQLPPAEKSVFDRSKLRLNGSIAVELGEDVTLSLDKAKARFQGTTVFNWKNELIPTGDGSYRVTGKITAYGQSLEVSQGKISFPRVPANNPRLDIRAERQIYGNVQVKQAGVLIGGTLKRPLLEAYTRPATTEERALALLVTGHDFDYEQGVGAVEVGMYIAPKLYVSYGIGLFENDSVVSLRYDLGRGFGIKATSSQRQSGGDVTYTIER